MASPAAAPTHLFFHPEASPQALDRELANWVTQRLQAGLNARSTASLAVSGGRTPIGFFALLHDADLDWSRIVITLVDERWVAPDHADSNERLLREHLLKGRAAAAQFVPLKFAAADPVAGAQLASRALAGIGEFDAVILGMGEDGHTASLFPDSPQLAAGLMDATGAACLATENATKAPRWRITLTAARIVRARALALHITGAQKWALLGEILSGSNAYRFPIRILFNQTEVDRHVFWCR